MIIMCLLMLQLLLSSVAKPRTYTGFVAGAPCCRPFLPSYVSSLFGRTRPSSSTFSFFHGSTSDQHRSIRTGTGRWSSPTTTAYSSFCIQQQPRRRDFFLSATTKTDSAASQKNNNANNEVPPPTDQSRHRAFLNRVRHTLEQHILFQVVPGKHLIFSQILCQPKPPKGDKPRELLPFSMIVSVSGGCDSMALLYSLYRLGYKKFLTCVVHFNHQQRGIDSDKDEQLVQHVCQEMQIPFRCYHWSDDKMSTAEETNSQNDDNKAFSQDAARKWRRSILQRLAKENSQSSQLAAGATSTPKPKILLLTAHHQDDAEETMLLKLLRGVHISKLSGLPALTKDTEVDGDDGEAADNIFWARPFIHVRKQEIVEYMKDRKYPWREDSSNQSPKYLRNRVRHELIPLLQDLVGGEDNLAKRLQNLEHQAQDVQSDLDQRVQDYFNESNTTQDVFLLPSTNSSSVRDDLVLKEALHRWVTMAASGADVQFTYEHLERLCQQIDTSRKRQWRINIGGGWDVVRIGDALRLAQSGSGRRDDNNSTTTTMTADDDSTTWPSPSEEEELEWYDVTRTLDDDAVQRHNSVLLKIALAAETTSSSSSRFVKTILGNRDLTITPPWRKSAIRVKDFLRGQKAPLHLRPSTPIILLVGPDDNQPEKQQQLVAVYIFDKSQWIVDSAFQVCDEHEGQKEVCLVVSR